MEFRTYAEMKAKIGNEYDITDERFVSAQELLDYFNDAIDDAETAIHTMHHEDKYFLVPSTFTWVSGTQDYSLPSDIYGSKIRLIQYSNGAEKYPITRIKKLDDIPYIQSGDRYQYLLINTTALGPQIRFYPAPSESSNNAIIWYVRNMRRLTSSLLAANTCEIPESANFIYQHVRRAIAKKTRRPDLIAIESSDLLTQYNVMLEALKDMTVDQDNEMVQDLSSYNEQAGFFR